MNLPEKLATVWGELSRDGMPWETAIRRAWGALSLEDEPSNHRWFCQELATLANAPYDLVEALFHPAVLNPKSPAVEVLHLHESDLRMRFSLLH